MFTVDPSGITKLETELLIPRFSSAHSIVTGSAAELDEVENAMSCVGRAARRNTLSLSLAMYATMPP